MRQVQVQSQPLSTKRDSFLYISPALAFTPEEKEEFLEEVLA
jgi:hypothetical protein